MNTILQELLEKEQIQEGDLALAKAFSSSAEVQFFLTFLIKTAREGHLCIPMEMKELVSFSKQYALESFFNEKLALLERAKEHFLNWIAQDSKKFVVVDQDSLYLQKHWILETAIFQNIKKLFTSPKAPPQIEFPNHLHQDQLEAMRSFYQHDLFLLLGGPGTGKTYTAAHIVASFAKAFPKAKIVAAAPTGKAAKNLEVALQPLIKIDCTTLHSLLQIRSYRDCFAQDALCDADLLVIDESSMIDAAVFSRLLSSIKKGAKLLLIGDPNQLPPIESGSVFSDLMQLAKANFPIGYVQLEHCFRSDRLEILKLAQDVMQEDSSALLSYEGFKVLDPATFESLLWEYAKEHYLPHSSDVSLEKIRSFVMLSCLRKGSYGVDAINAQIARKIFAKAAFGSFFVAPIIVTRNSSRLQLHNGEMGLLVRRKTTAQLSEYFTAEDHVVFSPEKSVLVSDMPTFEYAYCLSVHKSQGSEYDNAMLIIPKGSEVFGKEILYTAITRVKEKLILVGNEESIQAAIKKRYRRHSQIYKRFLNETRE